MRTPALDLNSLITPSYKDPHAYDNREILRTYKGKRLVFEGVLIAIYRPSAVREQYQLVFASVAALHQHIELDHIVVHTDKSPYNLSKTIGVGKRYRFAGDVTPYKKVQQLLHQPAQTENYMLTNINLGRLETQATSTLMQPTEFVRNRVRSVAAHPACPYDKDELTAIALTYPNDGAIESYFEEWRRLTKPENVEDVAQAFFEACATDSRRRR